MKEHSNLFLVETPGHFNPFNKAQSTDVDMSVYVNSKMLFYETANNERLVNFATELVSRRCAAERQTVIHKLQLAKTNPEDIPTLFEDRSLSGTVSGEVLYLTRFETTVVRIRATEHGWNAVPVTVVSTDTPRFMSAKTHRLTDLKERIPCSKVTPPIFKSINEFMEVGPVVWSAPTPEILAPLQKIDFRPNDRTSNSGLYTQDDLADYSRQLSLGETRVALRTPSLVSPRATCPYLTTSA